MGMKVKGGLLVVVAAVCLFVAVQGSAIQRKFKDCDDVLQSGFKQSGVYTIHLNGSKPIKVFCNHTSHAPGSAAVIMRRWYGNVPFNRNWKDYKVGFGVVEGDFWIGLDTMNILTSKQSVRLRIDMQDWNGAARYAIYQHFRVGNEASGYRLSALGYSGNVPDDMYFHHNMVFATPDRPDARSCAIHQKTGWWFNNCAYTLPTGVHYPGKYTPHAKFYDGIYWKDWQGYDYSLKFIEMSVIN